VFPRPKENPDRLLVVVPRAGVERAVGLLAPKEKDEELNEDDDGVDPNPPPKLGAVETVGVDAAWVFKLFVTGAGVLNKEEEVVLLCCGCPNENVDCVFAGVEPNPVAGVVAPIVPFCFCGVVDPKENEGVEKAFH